MAETVDSRKVKRGPREALDLVRAADHLYVAKGKHVRHVNLRRDAPSDDELLGLVMGPTGNLRAPTLRVGNALFVGFNPDLYAEHLAR